MARAFHTVREFLDSQVRGRPQTFEEIVHAVGKSRFSCWREVNSMLVYDEVNVLVLRFNGRECPFYTVRKDVGVELIKGGVLVEVTGEQLVIALDELDRG